MNQRLSTNNDLAALCARARRFFASGATRPAAFRLEQLQRLAEAIERMEAGLLEALRDDLRRPETEAYASELGMVQTELRYVRRRLRRWMRPSPRRTSPGLWPGRSAVLAEPLGTVLIMAPWNYPFQLLFGPLVSAVAAGNCVALKPSELAPRTSAIMAELIRQTFRPEHVFAVEGDADTARALLELDFDHIFFTGSTRVGRSVYETAARRLIPVTLELGGKCPCIVCGDADPDVAARRIAWGKFMNAGQTCVAPDYVLAERGIRDRLVDSLRAAIGRFFGDDPQLSPDYGRIVNRGHLDRLVSYFDGGSLAIGGKSGPADLYISPTIMLDPDLDHAVMREEIFGPILPVLAYDRLEQALEVVRARPKPLALYVFARERGLQRACIEGVASGGVCVNDTVSHIIPKGLPFGGVGQSGMGSYHGKAGFDCFTHHRSVLQRPMRPDFTFRYPPTRVSLRALKAGFNVLFRW